MDDADEAVDMDVDVDLDRGLATGGFVLLSLMSAHGLGRSNHIEFGGSMWYCRRQEFCAETSAADASTRASHGRFRRSRTN